MPGESLPFTALTPTASLPAPQCAYQAFHIDNVATGPNVSSTDGMSFSPDGTKIVYPLQVSIKSQIQVANADGSERRCLTCGQTGNNDGVRWRPTVGDAIIFISDRDHPYATGNAGGGFGQELYAMKPDGSQPTRLTTSDAWATNYHVNWSPDGQRIVWGSTEAYSWDVMVADFVADSTGMHLANQRRVVHDTTWWETHGFTPDEKSIITTNTQAGFQSHRPLRDRPHDRGTQAADDRPGVGRARPPLARRARDRVDLGPLAPRERLAAQPGVARAGVRLPLGRPRDLLQLPQPSRGLHVGADDHGCDGQNVRALTNDSLVVADSQWSADGRKIIFRQSTSNGQTTKHPRADVRRLPLSCGTIDRPRVVAQATRRA